MNILVIGNGFDLAHGLPTKYGHFLEFCRMIRSLYDVYSDVEDEKWEEKWERLAIARNDKKTMEKKFKELFLSREVEANTIGYFTSINGIYDTFDYCTYDNIWIRYFKDCLFNQNNSWIDFEKEMSRVIQLIENDMKVDKIDEKLMGEKLTEICFVETFFGDLYEWERNMEEKVNKEIEELEKQEGRKWNIDRKINYLQKYLKTHLSRNSNSQITYKQLIKKMEEDLKRLIRALEIYLADYVENIECRKISPDIQEHQYDAILSFNYTNTYERLYDLYDSPVVYNYIHGKADLEHKIESSNIVLGIDEYLSEERKDKDVDFIAFKKYYQRIYKGTGCEYKDWIDDIKKENMKYMEKIRQYEIRLDASSTLEKISIEDQLNDIKRHAPKHNLFIFGHSLDVTDRDILRGLILCDNMYTTIFYFDKEDLGSKITNLVKVIGQDELIRRAGGSTKTIEFKLQQDMVERV